MKITNKSKSNVKYVEILQEKFLGKSILELPKTKDKSPDLRNNIGFIRKIISESKKLEVKNLQINFTDVEKYLVGENLSEKLEFLVTNFLMADYKFDKFKTPPRSPEAAVYAGISEIYISGLSELENKIFSKALETGELIGTQVNACRDLANSPANIIFPNSLAKHAESSVKGVKNAKVKILNQKDLEKIEAGGILAVAAGSQHEPILIVMEYRGGKGGKGKSIDFCLVGKGVTHDNGGLNIKPSNGGSMEEMHLDMSGGAAVIHAFATLAKLKVNKNIVAIIPAVENSISGESYRPGDIIKMLSGKTVEVLNTDAEGRIILADALTYAQQNYKSEKIINIATLTGAAMVALGTGANAIMGTDKNFNDKLVQIGNTRTGDFLWELPLWDVYKSAVKNKRADIGNIPESNSRLAGSINGGMFLKEFINENQIWAHIDMAPRMVASGEDNLESGAMGETVRLMVHLVRKS